jgi:mannose-6-phosphate isomerase
MGEDFGGTRDRLMQLSATFVEKPWGRDHLPAQFIAPTGKRIGEIWFSHPDQHLALMIKYLFTSAALSVQVHPNDAQAQARALPHGKDECWYILDAEPGAKLAIGTKSAMTAEQLESASRDGSILDHLHWHDAIPGHIYEIPSGTVHAIGAGISLIEVQQNIDLTYRLYDYGSDRELHLADGVAVAQTGPYADHLHYPMPGSHVVQRPHYTLTICDGEARILPGQGPYYILPIDGALEIDGMMHQPGSAALVRSLDPIQNLSETRYLLARAA